MIIIGAGAVVNTGYIQPSNLIQFAPDKSVIVDKYLCAGPSDLFAAGDIAKFPLRLLDNELVRIEHWGYAMSQGRIAAKNMINGLVEEISPVVPFFLDNSIRNEDSKICRLWPWS